MKCRVCGKPASISLRSYKTALCEEDFLAFLEKRVSTTIRKYRLLDDSDKVVVAVSGGKDSLSLWYLLNKLGYASDGVYIDLGIDGYSGRSLEKIMRMADQLGRKAYVFHVRDVLQRGIDNVAKAIRRPACSACGTIKRYVMNRVCMDKGYTVLATGHNLDDEASALFGNVLYWKKEYLWKKDIILEGDEHLVKKIKPFFLCSEREIAAYAIVKGIDYIYEECPFSEGAKTLVYKGILNKLEEASPGTKIMFVKGYLKMVKEKGESREGGGREGRYCLQCGYPTFSEKCSFCWLLDKFGVENTVSFEQYG